MTPKKRSQNPRETLGFLADLVRQIRLLWRLLNDPRVPSWVKAIPVMALLYLFFPIDLIADPILGLGQLDDVAVILLGLKLFRDFCPPGLVREHEADIAGNASPWRVVEDPPGQELEASTIDAEYEILDKKE